MHTPMWASQEVVMPPSERAKTTRVEVEEHGDQLRSLASRQMEIRLPDMRAPSFASEAHRQSLAAARSKLARDDQAFIDAVSDLRG